MASQRNLFLIAFLFFSVMIWQVWQTEHNPKLLNSQSKKYTTNKFIKNIIKEKLITIKTDVLSLKINTRGGDINQAKLLTYPEKLHSDRPFQLLETKPDFIYQAQSGLTGLNGPDNPANGARPLYTTTQDYFQLNDGQNEIRVPLIFKAKNGVIYRKTFVLKRGEYAINVEYQINNFSDQPQEISMFGQLKQTNKLPKYRNISSNNFTLHTFRGAAYSSDKTNYKKYDFDKIINNKNLKIYTFDGWVAMMQQYFATAWVPKTKGKNIFYTNNLGNDILAIGYKSSPVIIAPKSQKHIMAILWIGPEIQDKMVMVAPYLDLTVDYGWLWFISQPLFKLLKFLNAFFLNWGFSIIIITFIVRGIMYPLTKAQYTSMAKMRILQPKIQAMRDRFATDKQKMSQEMMTLYKSERVNPLGGCLPLIIQMPIFLALYYMLMSSVELRHAPFTLWIQDLSSQDPYYILPIIMGITMFFIQKMSPTTISDPMQQKIMAIMPLIFIFFFLWFPSGLVLYYIVSNLVTIIQQQLIYRSLEKNGLYNRYQKKV